MKNLVLIGSIAFLFIAIQCSKETDTTEDCSYGCSTLGYFADTLSRSEVKTTKGHILFSWKNSENSWNYAVVPNLNITPAQENINHGNTVTGYECLKNNLGLFAEGEEIFWYKAMQVNTGNGLTVPLSYPPEDIINDIKEYCDSVNLVLNIE